MTKTDNSDASINKSMHTVPLTRYGRRHIYPPPLITMHPKAQRQTAAQMHADLQWAAERAPKQHPAPTLPQSASQRTPACQVCACKRSGKHLLLQHVSMQCMRNERTPGPVQQNVMPACSPACVQAEAAAFLGLSLLFPTVQPVCTFCPQPVLMV